MKNILKYTTIIILFALYGCSVMSGTPSLDDANVKVIFYLNNDSEEMPTSQTILNGNKVNKSNPKREDYIFDGWYTLRNGGVLVDLSTYQFTSSTELYAHWMIKQYTITFDANKPLESTGIVINVPMKQFVDIKKVVIEPMQAPVLKGYTFDGWHTDVTTFNVYNYNTEVYEDRTLYAKWILKP